MSSTETMNMTCEHKCFFECIRKEAFFEKKHFKLSNLKSKNLLQVSAYYGVLAMKYEELSGHLGRKHKFGFLVEASLYSFKKC